MNADELFRPIGRGREPRDRDRRGVGGDDGAVLQHWAQRRQDLAFDVLFLDGRFYGGVAICEGFKVVGGPDPRERRLAVVLADCVPCHLARHIAIDGCDSGPDAFLREVVERDFEAGKGAYMSDAAPHLTGADYAHSVNVSHVSIDHIVCWLFVQPPLPTLPASGGG